MFDTDVHTLRDADLVHIPVQHTSDFECRTLTHTDLWHIQLYALHFSWFFTHAYTCTHTRARARALNSYAFDHALGSWLCSGKRWIHYSSDKMARTCFCLDSVLTPKTVRGNQGDFIITKEVISKNICHVILTEIVVWSRHMSFRLCIWLERIISIWSSPRQMI